MATECTQDYSTDSFTPAQSVFLQDLRELGLVYQRKVFLSLCCVIFSCISVAQRASGRFYPTHLGINVLSGMDDV